MRTRAIDRCGDLATRGSQFVYDIEAVERLIHYRLKLFLSEYFRNIQIGVPWFEQILGKHADKTQGEHALRTTIAQTEGVRNINRFNVTYNDREIFVQCDVETIYGELSISYGQNN